MRLYKVTYIRKEMKLLGSLTRKAKDNQQPSL